MPTAGDQINRALRLLGVLAEGETPSNSSSQDGLTALNQMIDSWNIERLAVFSTLDQTVVWPANQATRTLGPSGNLPGTNVRPVRVEDSTYYVDSSGNSRAVKLINQEQYDAIPRKTTTSEYPQLLFVNMTVTNIELTIYPVATVSLTWHIISVRELTQPAILTTDFVLNPGYLRAFTYNLAMEMAPEFGVEPSRQVQRIAMASKRNLKRINNPNDVMTIPPIFYHRRGWYNINTDNY